MLRPKTPDRSTCTAWNRPRTLLVIGVALAVTVYSFVILVVATSKGPIKTAATLHTDGLVLAHDSALPLIGTLCDDVQYRDTPECKSYREFVDTEADKPDAPSEDSAGSTLVEVSKVTEEPQLLPSHEAPSTQVGVDDVNFFRQLVAKQAPQLQTATLLANELEVHFTGEIALVAVRKGAFGGLPPQVSGPQRGITLEQAGGVSEHLHLAKLFDFYTLRPDIAGLYQIHSQKAAHPPSQANQLDSSAPLEAAGPTVFLKFLYREQTSDETVKAINKLRRRIWENQNPPDCNKARISYYQLKVGMNYGVGVNTEYMVAAFARAMEQNRTFVLPTKKGPSNMAFYWAQDFCRQQSWLCYFHSISKCDETHLGVSNYMRLPDDSSDAGKMANTRVIKSIACPRKDGVVAAKSMAALAKEFTPYYEQDMAASPKLRGKAKYATHSACGDELRAVGHCIGSTMWVASYLTELVFRPRPWLLALFEKERQIFAQGWTHPMGVMHIRKTDKLVGKLKEARDPMATYDLDNYFRASDDLAAAQQSFSQTHLDDFNRFTSPGRTQPSLPQAYVATDTNTVIEAMQSTWGKPPHAPLLYFANQTRYELGTILQLRTKMGSVNQNEEAYNAIKDIWLLSEVCDFCIGAGFVAGQ